MLISSRAEIKNASDNKLNEGINMAIKLYVGGLAYSVTDQELNDFFAAVGKVSSAVVIKDRDSGKSKGFGFVEMENDEEGQKAIASLNGQALNGRSISVNQARPMEERRPRREGNGNRRNFNNDRDRRRY